MTRDETYEKWNNEKDTIRQIIALHSLDTICGNKRDDLNYVDGLYPMVEELFGVDTCIESIGNKDALRNYYEENYQTDVSYNDLVSYFDKVRNLCNELPEERKDDILKVSSEVIDLVADKVYNTKISKTNVK